MDEEELKEIYLLSDIEAKELITLIAEMRDKEFKYSKELSSYIVRHQLGIKYPNISGIIRMKNTESEWVYKGGFPRNIFAIVCKELKLSDQGSNAKAIGFTSFSEIQQNS